MKLAPLSLQCLKQTAGNLKGLSKGAKTLVQTARTQISLNYSSPAALYNRVKVMYGDPKAFEYGLIGRSKDILKSKEVLGAVQIQSRDKKDTVAAKVIKFVFQDDSRRYSVRKPGETLAYVDIVPEADNNLYIQYLCDIEGRDRFRALEKTVLQAAIEDTINSEYAIPTITAMPSEVGDLKFSRETLYRMMGASVRDFDIVHKGRVIATTPEVYCTKDVIIQKLEKIAQKGKFIFSETRANFEKLMRAD